MKRTAFAFVSVCLFPAALLADNWPGWRGVTGQGHSTEKNLPLTWSAKGDNVRWKAPLPDQGCSTPVVWGDRVFVTQASDKTLWPPKDRPQGGPAIAKKRSLLCFARADGKLLWQRDVIYDAEEPTHRTNPFCSASPATDGERVIVSHGSAGLHCYDFTGKELWKKDVGKLEHDWGNASSPVLYGDLCIQWCGPSEENERLLAVNKRTGDEVWKNELTAPTEDDKKDKNEKKAKKGAYVGSWSTPIIAKVNGQDQLLMSVPHNPAEKEKDRGKLVGLDPKTGKVVWFCHGLTNLVYTSPLYSDGIGVAMSGFGGKALAVKLGGTGDITKDRLWHMTKDNPQRIGSGVIIGDHLYMVEATGAPHCFELKTGKQVWEVETRPASGPWASLLHADGRLYVTDQGGTTIVLAASPKYELLATNRLGEHVDASIAVSNGDLFVRSFKHLWCIGNK